VFLPRCRRLSQAAADPWLHFDDGLTVRIEGHLPLDQAMAIVVQLD
jgi:hypothetical protein